MPPAMADALTVGTEVRLPLGGRRVGGWVLGLSDQATVEIALKPIAKLRGAGPEPDLIDLAGWAAWWWTSKRATFLRSASAPRAVPVTAGRAGAPPGRAPAPSGVVLPAGAGFHVIERPPADDPTPFVAAAAQAGPTLVIVPTVARAEVLAGRLRRAGADAALLPGDWAAARAGRAGVVVGTRAAAWGPCPGLAAVVVLDAHDEGLTSEGAPTWGAVAVAAERARRAAVPLYALTPCPTVELLAGGALTPAPPGRRREGWPITELIDRRHDDPRLGLWSDRLVRLVRNQDRVACILNRTGRVRLLGCAACGELARCEVCQAAVTAPAPGHLLCPRCGHERPALCTRCDSTRLKTLRIGVSRAREDLERLAGRPVGEVTASTGELPGTDLLIGTSALLHRLDPRAGVGAVAFVDFDQDLMAPRVRAAEQALALAALAGRIVRGRRGRLLIQTRLPDHPVVNAVISADPTLALDGEEDLRRTLGLPPFGAVAVVHGEAAAGWVSRLEGVDVAGPNNQGRWLVKAGRRADLCNALAAEPRPTAGTLRVAVDPTDY